MQSHQRMEKDILRGERHQTPTPCCHCAFTQSLAGENTVCGDGGPGKSLTQWRFRWTAEAPRSLLRWQNVPTSCIGYYTDPHTSENSSSQNTLDTHTSHYIYIRLKWKRWKQENFNTHEKIIIFKNGLWNAVLEVRTQAPPHLSALG